MKRVKCPKCDYHIIFDETKYREGQSLIFECPACAKQFGIKIKSINTPLENDRLASEKNEAGSIVVIENIFHYKQVIPLKLGENVIGRYSKGNKISTPIETDDPSIDTTHCKITVTKDNNGNYKYTLMDGPSNTGTFVNNEILGNREKRTIENGTLFTIGATSIILKTREDD